MPPDHRDDHGHRDDDGHRDSDGDIGRALRRLAQPRAPRTLLPRVMAAAGAQARRPVAARPWLAWTVGWQIASVAALLACAAGLAWIWPGAEAVIDSALSPVVNGVTAMAVDVADRTSVVVTMARVMRALVQSIAGYALAIVFVMGAACATFAAAFNRVAFGEHS
jgi:hypothetical protein